MHTSVHTRYSKLRDLCSQKEANETGSQLPPHCCFSECAVQVLSRAARGPSEKIPLLALGQSDTKLMPFLRARVRSSWRGWGREEWAQSLGQMQPSQGRRAAHCRHGPPHCCWRVPRPRQPLESLAPSTAAQRASRPLPPALLATTSAAAQPPAASLPSSTTELRQTNSHQHQRIKSTNLP